MNRYADLALALLAAAFILAFVGSAVAALRDDYCARQGIGCSRHPALAARRTGELGHALYLSLAAYVVAFGAVRIPSSSYSCRWLRSSRLR